MTSQEGSLVGQTLGVYRLRSLLGVGGMAEVYLAEDPSLRRDIAVKVLPRSLATDPGYVERFRNEAQRVASLSHPHITPVYTFGEERGLLYLVMPRLKESLRERMEREGILSLQEAARVTNQIAAALHIAHQHGIVHRDVKPENILLDETGKAMLTDFGIARELSALREAGIARTLAATGLPVGTPEYMAPEQLRGQPATEQVDLYALGVVLYEMLTAHVPYDASTPYEVATAVMRDPLIPPSHYNPDLSPEVESIILTAMAKEPAERYSDMKKFALDLRDATTGSGRSKNSGALRWTQYAKPNSAVSAGAVAGVAASRSLASASSSLIRPPQIPLSETAKRPTIGAAPTLGGGYSGSASEPLHKRRSRGAIALFSLVALFALGGLVAAAMYVPSAMGLFTYSVGSPSLVAKATATTAPTATTMPTATATATPAPTQTPIYVYVPVTPTAAPNPALSISSTTIILPQSSNCVSSQINISNPDSTTVTWQWVSMSPLTTKSLSWKLNGSWHLNTNTMPTDTKGIAPNGTDTLTLYVSCSTMSKASPTTVKMTDSLGRSYTLTLKYE
ncbi:MAG TPA: serine/threonine-protein kinase [Ktedonobacterales bacterium]|nr:serine/threonine-protein kinase [Ktedonobacterales bacterium]